MTLPAPSPSGSPVSILAFAAGLGGASGNSAALVSRAIEQFGDLARVRVVSLVDEPGFEPHREAIAEAEGFVFATGTYWDSWSSALQRFLEQATPSEGTDLWLGKPASVLVTAHSVGGKGVLSRLQGVLCTFGCAIPPMSGIVVKLSSQAALESGNDDHVLDFWCPDDLEIVNHNLLEAARGTRRFRSWEVDRKDPARRWIRAERR